jgi:NAD-dependent deacetylase
VSRRTGVAEVAALLRGAERVAVLTGAGISAESGIPTFRDALTGLWATFDPEDLATPEAFRRQPQVVWDWYAERRAAVTRAQPNPGHLALAEVERQVPRFTLVTQNIDGLHQLAGQRNVIELHGNLRRVKCAGEGTPCEAWDEAERPPRCPTCGDYLRPDVVWFGELLPLDGLRAAWAAAEGCDLFLSIGTSNLVEPAASLPWMAHAAGARVVVVNPTDEGQRRGERILHLPGKAGEMLPAVVQAAWQT